MFVILLATLLCAVIVGIAMHFAQRSPVTALDDSLARADAALDNLPAKKAA